MTLVLALVATQFSINAQLPSSSYMLPTQQLVGGGMRQCLSLVSQ